MKIVRKTYVESWTPFSYWETVQVKVRDLSKIRVDEKVYRFRLFDRLSTTVIDRGKPVKLISERLNVSPLYYYGGMVVLLKDLQKSKIPPLEPLIEQLQKSEMRTAVIFGLRNGAGDWKILEKGDVVIDIPQRKKWAGRFWKAFLKKARRQLAEQEEARQKRLRELREEAEYDSLLLDSSD